MEIFTTSTEIRKLCSCYSNVLIWQVKNVKLFCRQESIDTRKQPIFGVPSINRKKYADSLGNT